MQHRDNPGIRGLLEHQRLLWQQDIPAVGILHCYATQSGLVHFVDYYDRRGWMMLTECPSNGMTENLYELRSMTTGTAGVRTEKS